MQSSLIFKMLVAREREKKERMLLSINFNIFGISLCMKKRILSIGAILDGDSNYRCSGPRILTHRVGNNGRQYETQNAYVGTNEGKHF